MVKLCSSQGSKIDHFVGVISISTNPIPPGVTLIGQTVFLFRFTLRLLRTSSGSAMRILNISQDAWKCNGSYRMGDIAHAHKPPYAIYSEHSMRAAFKMQAISMVDCLFPIPLSSHFSRVSCATRTILRTMNTTQPPWRYAITALAAAAVFPYMRETWLQLISRVLLASLAAWYSAVVVYAIFIYPYFVSPIRHIPGPKVSAFSKCSVSEISHSHRITTFCSDRL